MINQGPALETLTQHLLDCPIEFQEPFEDPVDFIAVVSDLRRDLGGKLLRKDEAELFLKFVTQIILPDERQNLIRIILIGAWLFHDDWFISKGRFWKEALKFLYSPEIKELAETVQAKKIILDPDRREEFVRRCLACLKLRPAGESPHLSEDRLATLDSLALRDVLAESKKAQERAQKVVEALKKKAQEEAAAKVTRE